ncbi:MAG TPA: hypothetical protein VKH37_02525 [Ferruginibacter sp.]|nr:hypothetical protein [Ferruginibacter sp.]
MKKITLLTALTFACAFAFAQKVTTQKPGTIQSSTQSNNAGGGSASRVKIRAPKVPRRNGGTKVQNTQPPAAGKN